MSKWNEEKEKIIEKFNSPSVNFYGTMYGDRYITNLISGKGIVKKLDRILKIDKKDINIALDKECFWYQWGWPGPDINIYYFKDYGFTWAFDINDFVDKEVLEFDID